MTFQVFVDGQEGTTGLRIHEYLARRDDVTLLSIDPALRKDPAARRALINASDVTFLCLPDAAAKESVTLVDNPRTCIIDASTVSHRPRVDLRPARTRTRPAGELRTASIANPGCHASAFILAVKPLVAAGILLAWVIAG